MRAITLIFTVVSVFTSYSIADEPSTEVIKKPAVFGPKHWDIGMKLDFQGRKGSEIGTIQDEVGGILFDGSDAEAYIEYCNDSNIGSLPLSDAPYSLLRSINLSGEKPKKIWVRARVSANLLHLALQTEEGQKFIKDAAKNQLINKILDPNDDFLEKNQQIREYAYKLFVEEATPVLMEEAYNVFIDYMLQELINRYGQEYGMLIFNQISDSTRRELFIENFDQELFDTELNNLFEETYASMLQDREGILKIAKVDELVDEIIDENVDTSRLSPIGEATLEIGSSFVNKDKNRVIVTGIKAGHGKPNAESKMEMYTGQTTANTIGKTTDTGFASAGVHGAKVLDSNIFIGGGLDVTAMKFVPTSGNSGVDAIRRSIEEDDSFRHDIDFDTISYSTNGFVETARNRIDARYTQIDGDDHDVQKVELRHQIRVKDTPLTFGLEAARAENAEHTLDPSNPLDGIFTSTATHAKEVEAITLSASAALGKRDNHTVSIIHERVDAEGNQDIQMGDYSELNRNSVGYFVHSPADRFSGSLKIGHSELKYPNGDVSKGMDVSIGSSIDLGTRNGNFDDPTLMEKEVRKTFDEIKKFESLVNRVRTDRSAEMKKDAPNSEIIAQMDLRIRDFEESIRFLKNK